MGGGGIGTGWGMVRLGQGVEKEKEEMRKQVYFTQSVRRVQMQWHLFTSRLIPVANGRD